MIHFEKTICQRKGSAMARRQRHSAAFKAKVALEAIKGMKTRQEIATEFSVHPGQVSVWKKELLENIGDVFSNKKARADREHEEEKAVLFEQIGRLQMELEWLKKKFESLD